MAVSIREAKYLLAHPEILLGLAEGKIIECKRKSADAQWETIDAPSFVDNVEYRVKPEPRKFFITVRNNGTTDFVYEDNDAWKKVKSMIDINEYGLNAFKPYTYVEVLEQLK